jgi:cellulose biosynthesis protein BcsQ
VVVGSIRLDFLAFAAQVIPFVLDANSPLSVVIEAKHPNQNLNNHVRRLKSYLTSLNVRYGLLTNGKQIRVYEKVKSDIQLVFQCNGKDIVTHIDEIKAIIGRNSLKQRIFNNSSDASTTQSNRVHSRSLVEINAPQMELPSEHSLDSDWESNDFLFPAYQELKRIEQLFYPNSEEKMQHIMKTIAIYHNKGGVGKTTTVVNLATALRKKGNRVLVIDLDSQANTTYATGLIKFEDEEHDDIKDCNVRHLLQSEEFYPIQEVVRESQFSSLEIDVVPCHITLMKYENELAQIESSKMMLIEKLKAVAENYDFVIIDTPPSFNLFAKIALITADYLIIPSDLKPFANQGLLNVKEFVKQINYFRNLVNKSPIEILGVLPCKISTNARFVQYTLPRSIELIPKRYGFNVMDAVIYQREELSKCVEQSKVVGNTQIPDPKSVFDYKPDGDSAKEFELLAMEVLQKIGSKP